MTKIDIISGFLGAGKTTLIKKLLSDAYKGEQVVLIENEFGEIGIDGGFLKEAGIEIREMNSGCICCSLVGDFGKSLHEVVDTYHPDRILIEPSGVGKLSDEIKAEIKSKFFGGFCDDEQTKATIKALFDTDNYLCDTHTAVAVNVYEQYVEQTGDTTPSVIASTASPYKFSKAVLEAVSDGTDLPENEFDMVEKLFEVSNAPVPAPLAALKDKKARFSDVTEVNSMPQYVLDALNIK